MTDIIKEDAILSKEQIKEPLPPIAPKEPIPVTPSTVDDIVNKPPPATSFMKNKM